MAGLELENKTQAVWLNCSDMRFKPQNHFSYDFTLLHFISVLGSHQNERRRIKGNERKTEREREYKAPKDFAHLHCFIVFHVHFASLLAAYLDVILLLLLQL